MHHYCWGPKSGLQTVGWSGGVWLSPPPPGSPLPALLLLLLLQTLLPLLQLQPHLLLLNCLENLLGHVIVELRYLDSQWSWWQSLQQIFVAPFGGQFCTLCLCWDLKVNFKVLFVFPWPGKPHPLLQSLQAKGAILGTCQKNEKNTKIWKYKKWNIQ